MIAANSAGVNEGVANRFEIIEMKVVCRLNRLKGIVFLMTSPKRSRMMAAVRSTNTKPELMIRRALHAKGFRFRLHVKDLAGRPDIVLPKYRAAIFINGCFWHGHDCGRTRLPSSNREYWRAKIEGNMRRDAEALTRLAIAGWRTLTVWECAITGKKAFETNKIADMIAEWLVSYDCSTDIAGLDVVDK